MIVWMSLAMAGDVAVDVPFAAPAEIALPTSAAVMQVKGKVVGEDCAAAVDAALAELNHAGTLVRVVVSPDHLADAGQLMCRQRVAGDFIASSTVTINGLVVQPGAGPDFRPVTPERLVRVLTVTAGLAGGDLAAVRIAAHGGSPWLVGGTVAHPDKLHSAQLDANARAARVYADHVPAWVSRWAPVLSPLTELAGSVLTIEVDSEDPARKKSKARELFRFRVTAASAGAFLAGRMTDEQFLAVCEIEHASSARKPEFQPLSLGLIEGDLAVEREHGTVERAGLDVSEGDLEGLDDEATEVGEEWERQ